MSSDATPRLLLPPLPLLRTCIADDGDDNGICFYQ